MADPTIDELYKSLAAADAAGDTASAQILADYIRSIQTPKQTSMMDELGRQAGLSVRPMAQAVMSAGGMLPMVVDPAVNFLNLAAGTNVPTMTQAMPRTLSAMGFPEPQTAQERVAQDISTAGYGVTGAANLAKQALPAATSVQAQEFLKMLATNPRAQASAATASTAAAGALREGGAPPYAQMAGALMTGMVAPGSGTSRALLNKPVVAPVSSMVQPFTQEGRETIIGSLLNRLSTDPTRAQQNLANAVPLVPGVRPTTAATAYDPGLASAETAIRALDQSGAFATQLSANQQALLDSYRRISGKSGSIVSAETKRAARTGPMREQAFENRAPVFTDAIDAQIQATLSDPMKQRTTVTDAMKEVQRLINARKAPDGTIDPAALYSVRKDISQIMSGALQGEKANLKLAKGELRDLLPVIDNVIESGAPGFKSYMDKFSKMSGPIDQMRLLQDIERRVTTGQPNIMTGEPVLAAGQLRRQLATKADELDLKLSIPAQQRLDNIINEINRGMAATAPGVKAPGSDTFKNMSMGNLIGRVFSESMASNTTLRTMTRPLDFLYKLPDQQIQQLLVEAMLDPKLAAMMMSKANMMKVQPLATSLRAKANQLGFGTAIGASQAGQ